MRHRKDTVKLGRKGAHIRCMMANMLKSLILNERLITTVGKGKELSRYADRMITLAKENNLVARRRATSQLMVRYNKLTSKEARAVKEGKKGAFNGDREVVEKLFGTLAPRFAARAGGYTRVLRVERRAGDNAETCLLEFLPE